MTPVSVRHNNSTESPAIKIDSSDSVQYEGELYLEILTQNVSALPNKECLAFLDSQGDIIKSFTRRQLWDYSEVVATSISREHGVTEGDRVMIVYPPGIDYAVAFIACLRLGAVVVSVYPPNPAKLRLDVPKFSHFVADSGSQLALTTKSYKKAVKMSAILGQKWPKLTWIATDDYDRLPSRVQFAMKQKYRIDQAREPSDLALIQYTSGSTGNPKGVMISHGNLSHQSNFAIKSYTTKVLQIPKEQVKYIGWVPQGCLFPLFGGYTAYNMSPISFLRDPTLWPRVLQRYSAHLTCGPNFAYNLACKRTEAAGMHIDLSGMLSFTNGGEPLDPSTPARVKKTWNTAEGIFRNAYGQAETTLAVSCLGNGTHQNRVSVGDIDHSLSLGLEVCIAVMSDGKYVHAEDGEEGEVWNHSPSVALGYWNKPELTAETFRATLQGGGSKQYHRSGDVGYIHEGKLYVTTRLKDLIIVNGKNFAPTDIEKCAEDNFAVIRPGCSVAFQPNSEPHAILVCEVRAEQVRQVVLERLANDIRALIVSTVEVPIGAVVLVRARTVPKTTSGKVQRKKCAEGWAKGSLDVLYSTQGDANNTVWQQDVTQATNLEQLLTAAGVNDWDCTLASNGIDSLQLSQIVTAAQKIGICVPYQQAMQMSANELLHVYGQADISTGDVGIRLPVADTVIEAHVQHPSIVRSIGVAVRQLVVIVCVSTTVIAATIPSAVLTNELWGNASVPSWFWSINGRLGPISVIAVSLWMVSYTVLCVILKWVMTGRQTAGPKQGYGIWSQGYMRWMVVQGVFNIWEHTCGRFIVDTPFLNIVYILLGAHIHPSARLQSFFRDWDLVTIGSGSTVKGMLLPHFYTTHAVVFNTVKIGKGCTVGAQSVAQAPLTLADECDVQNCSYLAPHTTLGSGSYEGNPAKPCNPKALDKNTEATYTPWLLTRLLLPAVFICFSTLTVTGVGFLLPDVSAYTARPVWSVDYLLVVATYLAMYQLLGCCMLLASVLLKWTFLCPYITDAFANVAFYSFFLYLSKTFAIKYWHRLFGMTIGKDSAVLTTIICSASTAHKVVVGEGCLLVNCKLSPSQGPTVWSWVRGRTTSPWQSLDTDRIIIDDYAQILLQARIEANVRVRKSGIVAAFTRVLANSTVHSNVTAIGNPYVCQAETPTAAEPLRPVTLSISGGGPSTDSIYNIHPEVVVSHDVYAEDGFKKVQVKVPETPPIKVEPDATFKQSLTDRPKKCDRMKTKQVVYHVVLVLSTLITLGICASVALMGVASLPIYSMHYIPRVMLAVLYGLVCLVVILWALIWVAKWVLIGKPSEGEIDIYTGTRSVVYLYLQGLNIMIGEQMICPLFSGTFVMNLYNYSMGADVSLLHTQTITDCIEPADAHLITLRPGVVLDRYSYALSHRAAQGTITFRSTSIMNGAVLHPGAGIILGSVGSNTQVMPLSMPLREMHMAEDEVWVGAPAVRAKVVECKEETEPTPVTV